jgi:4-amino-4-deoxy-L-arabinose transferase-like glycosyltransferase
MINKYISSDQYRLALILILATLLRLLFIEQEGYGNLYYAATVKSMLQSWSNFFYAAYDPAGFISVDKPPLGFWVTTIFAKVLGFNGWVIILPQVLAGLGSIVVLFTIVKRHFSNTAGLYSVLFLAITPIFVAANRNNTIDSMLILCLLIGVWYLLNAIETQRWQPLLMAFLMLGIGFNIKMMQAFVVLPAFIIAYLWCAKTTIFKRLLQLAAAGIIMLVVSLSWAVIVDLTPSASRPLVSNSNSNSVLELIVGHNAADRFSGPGQPPDTASNPAPPSRLDGQKNPKSPLMRSHMTPQMETGKPGIFRLYNRQLSGQIMWFAPLAMFGIFLYFRKIRGRGKNDVNQQAQIWLWILWIVPLFLFFSFTPGLFHRYYLATMAPPLAALAGIGLAAILPVTEVTAKTFYNLLFGLVITAVQQIFILSHYGEVPEWFIYAFAFLVTIAIGITIWQKTNPTIDPDSKRFFANSVIVVAVVLLPFIWSVTPLLYGNDPHLPYAGPELRQSAMQSHMDGPHNLQSDDTSNLIRFLEKNHKEETFFVAVPSAVMYGSKLILKTNRAVLTLGGFNGTNAAIGLTELQAMIAAKKVRYFLIPKPPAQPPPPGGDKTDKPNMPGMPSMELQEIYRWVSFNGREVPFTKWGKSHSPLQQFNLFEINFGGQL